MESSGDQDDETMDEDVRRERMRVLASSTAEDVLQVKVCRSKVVSSFFIDDIFYVVIVFKIHEIIYLRKRQYILQETTCSH
jgi:hypothetical protein